MKCSSCGQELPPTMSLEEFVCRVIHKAASDALRKLPYEWFGTYNALSLYLDHPHCSPFIQETGEEWWCKRKPAEIDKLIHRGYPGYQAN